MQKQYHIFNSLEDYLVKNFINDGSKQLLEQLLSSLSPKDPFRISKLIQPQTQRANYNWIVADNKIL